MDLSMYIVMAKLIQLTVKMDLKSLIVNQAITKHNL